MAQASSVQREPSMEEILASIRRIIEDSDGVRKGAEDLSVHEDPRDERPNEAVVEVDAFRAELRAASAAPVAENTPTLADVQAQMAVEDLADAPAAYKAEKTVAEENPSEQTVAGWSHGAAPAPEPEATFDQEFEAAMQEIPVEQPGKEAASRMEASMVPPRETARPAIISEHTGRQVAAAFGELSEAFAARSRRSFDEMAEQMLRPMLQDWLDNNLPTLVERLVREEIERVARGG